MAGFLDLLPILAGKIGANVATKAITTSPTKTSLLPPLNLELKAPVTSPTFFQAYKPIISPEERARATVGLTFREKGETIPFETKVGWGLNRATELLGTTIGRGLQWPQQVAFRFAQAPAQETSLVKQFKETGKEAIRYARNFFRGETPPITGRDLLKTRGIDLDKNPSLGGEFMAAGLDVLADPVLVAPTVIRGVKKAVGTIRVENALKNYYSIIVEPRINNLIKQGKFIGETPTFESFRKTMVKSGILDAFKEKMGGRIIKETLKGGFTVPKGTYFFGGLPVPKIPKNIMTQFSLTQIDIANIQAGKIANYAPAVIKAVSKYITKSKGFESLFPRPSVSKVAKMFAPEGKPPVIAPEVAKTPIVEPTAKGGEIANNVYTHQDNNAEKLTYEWSKPNNSGKGGQFGNRIENAGDILRELSKYGDNPTWFSEGYIKEKVEKLDAFLWGQRMNIGTSEKSDLSRAYAIKHNKELIDKFIDAYEKQPTVTNEQEIARQLVLDLLQGDWKAAQTNLEKIRTFISNESQTQTPKLSPKEGVQPKAGGMPIEPKPSIPEDKIRKFITTVKGAEKTAPEVKAVIESRYTPITNKDTLIEAQTLVETSYNEAVKLALEDITPTPKSNAVAINLIDKAQTEGRWEDAKTLIEKTAERNTKLGQTIQSLAMYERLSPEGILRYADSTIKTALNKLPKEKLAKWEKIIKNITSEKQREFLAKKIGVPYMSEDLMKKLYERAKYLQSINSNAIGEEAKKIVSEFKKSLLKEDLSKLSQLILDKIIKDITPQRIKAIEIALIMKDISKTIPKDLLSKISILQIFAQLLNPKTTVRNLLGNTGFMALENISDSVGTSIDMGVSFMTGKRTQYLPNLTTQFKGLGKGWEEGLQEALLGIDLGKLGTKFDLPQNSIFDSGVLGGCEKLLSVVLRAPDKAAYQAAFNASISNSMKGITLKEPTIEMIEMAHLDGLYRTFQDDSCVAKVLTNIKKGLNVGKNWGLGDLVIKYPKTPGNIIARGIEYSPIGFCNTCIDLAKPLISGESFNQRKFVKDTSRALVGTALLVGVGAVLAKIGIMTGKATKDKDVSTLMRNIGLGDYVINISALKRLVMSGFDLSAAKPRKGDITANYDWFQPASISMAIGANLMTSEGDSILESIADAGNTLVEQPMIRGLKTLFSTGDIIKGIGDVVSGMPASFTPTLLNQVKQLTDNISRNTNDPNYFKELVNRTIYKIPGFSTTLPERITTFGQPQEMYKEGTNNPFNVFLNPAFVARYNPTPEAEMVLNIWKSTGEKMHFPRVAPTNVKINGENIRLTGKQQAQYQSYIGNKTAVLYSILANDQMFMRMPDDVKAKKLQGFLTDINQAAKIEVLGDNPRKVSQDVRSLLLGISGWYRRSAYSRSKTVSTNRQGFQKFTPKKPQSTKPKTTFAELIARVK